MTDRMSIVHLTARRVLGLREASLTIGDGLEIHGENGSGKTSVVAAIAALVKRGGGDVQAVGEDAGEILAKLVGDDGKTLEIKRELGNGLEVLEGDGDFRHKVGKPQAFVEQLFGPLTFDPLAFASADARRQREMFCEAFPCDVSGVEGAAELAERHGVSLEGHGMEAVQRLEKAIFDTRHEAGKVKTRKVKAAEEAAPARQEVSYDPAAHEGARDDVAAARHELADLARENERRAAHNDATDAALAVAEEQVAESARLREEAARLIAKADDLDTLAQQKRDWAQGREHFDPVDRSDLEAKIREAEERAAGFARDAEAAQEVERWRKLEEEAAEEDVRYRALTDQLDQVRGPITTELVRQIECGIEGVTIKGAEITVGGVPVRQLNRQQQVAFGVQVAAALCKDKPVRIVVVDNAESITETNRRALEEECERLGMQWLFLVASEGATPEGAVRVEDGVVATQAS